MEREITKAQVSLVLRGGTLKLIWGKNVRQSMKLDKSLDRNDKFTYLLRSARVGKFKTMWMGL